ncbi:hypothetical protein AALA79_21350 [Lachnospiraceae bacterium 64-25]
MNINHIFELSMVLDGEKFHKVFDKVRDHMESLEKIGDEYIDHSLDSEGMTITYRSSQYRKKIKILVSSGACSKWSIADPEKFIRKLDKRIKEYFGFKYKLNDFNLSGMTVVADINVGNSKMVTEYLKVLKRIGRVKRFSTVSYECFDNNSSFCMEGNSNGIDFLLYDLKSTLANQLRQAGIKRKELKSVVEEAEGVLRSEVRLTKPKAIRAYTKGSDIFAQIVELSEKSKDVFFETATRIVPFGDFYKKDEAVQIIQRDVKDNVMRRKMLRLVELIPEKKSLYLAQKAMEYRNMEKVVESFAKINVSPVTISKRHNIKYLKNLYAYIF